MLTSENFIWQNLSDTYDTLAARGRCAENIHQTQLYRNAMQDRDKESMNRIFKSLTALYPPPPPIPVLFGVIFWELRLPTGVIKAVNLCIGYISFFPCTGQTAPELRKPPNGCLCCIDYLEFTCSNYGNIGAALKQRGCAEARRYRRTMAGSPALPENTRHWIIVGTMLGHRRRRWPNNEPTMIECLVFAGITTGGGDCIILPAEHERILFDATLTSLAGFQPTVRCGGYISSPRS